HAQAIPRFRALLAARHGKLVLEEYFAGTDASTLFDVRSVTKSVTGALTGIAVREGKVSTDLSLSALSPTYTVDAADAAVTVQSLLTMTSGFQWSDAPDYNPWILSDNRVQYLLDRPHAQPPGAVFDYDSAAVHVLGVVLARATATPLPQYAHDHL